LEVPSGLALSRVVRHTTRSEWLGEALPRLPMPFERIQTHPGAARCRSWSFLSAVHSSRVSDCRPSGFHRTSAARAGGHIALIAQGLARRPSSRRLPRNINACRSSVAARARPALARVGRALETAHCRPSEASRHALSFPALPPRARSQESRDPASSRSPRARAVSVHARKPRLPTRRRAAKRVRNLRQRHPLERAATRPAPPRPPRSRRNPLLSMAKHHSEARELHYEMSRLERSVVSRARPPSGGERRPAISTPWKCHGRLRR
jgi:hypothetical protein